MGKVTQKHLQTSTHQISSIEIHKQDPSKASSFKSVNPPDQDLGLQKNAPLDRPEELPSSSPLFVRSQKTKISAGQQFAVIRNALMGIESSSSEAVEQTLQNLGYRLDGSHLKKEMGKVRIRPTRMGKKTGHIIEFKRGKKKFKIIAFSKSVVSIEQWQTMKTRFDKVVCEFEKAREKNPKSPLPTNLAELKDYLDKGLSKSAQTKDALKEAELQGMLDQLTARLKRLKEQSSGPKGVVVYVAGPDAAGKSSTGAIVIKALQAAGFDCRRESFKAPTADERKQHWLKRFERGVPADNQAVFWDRGPAGDTVYGDVSKPQIAVMGREFSEFEAKLRNDNILVMKIELFASLDKQADTFGKRLGRLFIAENIRAELQKAGQLTPEAEEGLNQIMTKVDDDDFRALANFEDIQASFLGFAEASSDTTPWAIIDATKRHKARLKIINKFSETLEKFVDERSEI